MEAPARVDLFPHADALAPLNQGGPLEKQLGAIHEALYAELGTVDRISVLGYDAATDTLKTFLESSPSGSALVRYEAKLSETPSLAEILESGRPRVVNDLEVFRRGERVHTRIIAEEQYRSSYTVPMHLAGTFEGFVFFNSRTVGAFANEGLLQRLDVYAHLISATVAADLVAVRVLTAVVKTAHDMIQYRDPETGAHTDRMARYARLIAQYLAAQGVVDFSDETIERIFQYAPLHDIGKIAMPDRLLLKGEALSPAERQEMQAHTVRGRQMIDSIARGLGLAGIEGLDLLRHIAELHHEAMDGSGYPYGLRDGHIPYEARIIAVADVFDALTSRRPYKPSWSNAEALAWLRRFARTRFDEQCVEALAFDAAKVAGIQRTFSGEPKAA
jgi:HD-GYP domain-containing protein (c-di-GMP phosphodiesterase class II)